MARRKDRSRPGGAGRPDPQLGMEALLGEPGGGEGPGEPKVYGVGEVVRLASRTLERSFGVIWVEGEISNLKRIASGHVFFSLKDGGAQVSAVMFRSDARRVRGKLANGDAVRCRGSLRIYEAQGRFQLYVSRIQPVGLGELMLALEELKTKLAAEGLFDPARKRPLPPAPRVLGVVTSRTGAALRDIIQVAHARGGVRIIVSHTPVQGADAPPKIVAALGRLAARPEVDAIIIGRGGGSVEDLWCFNDERVARAVAACPKPIISAVGHEVDFTLCDHAADLRAATPSAAAELAVPDERAQRTRLQRAQDRLRAAGQRALDSARLRLTAAQRRMGDPRPLLLDARVGLDGLSSRLAAAMSEGVRHRRRRLGAMREGVIAGHPRARLARRRAELERAASALRIHMGRALGVRREGWERLQIRLPQVALGEAERRRAGLRLLAARLGELSPLRVLARGYAVAVDPDGRAVRAWDQVEVGDPLLVRLAEGELLTQVTGRRHPEELGARGGRGEK